MGKQGQTASMDRDQYAAELADELPTDDDELLAIAAAAIGELHAAVIAGDLTMAEQAAQRYEACIWKWNGGTFFGSSGDETATGNVIGRHCRAEPGPAPMWGQRGAFLVVVDGVRALVEFETGFGPLHCHFAFHAIDLDAPFVSETGYWSHFDAAQGGRTVGQVATAALRAQLVERNGPVMINADSRDRLADEPLPGWLEGLDPPARREPARIPAGYELVDVILPAHQAFIARKWAEAARSRLAVARSVAEQEAAARAEEGEAFRADG